MNPEKLIQMMNELPDEMIDSANQSRFRKRKKFRYIIPAIAACIVGVIAVSVYHRLQMQTPEIAKPPMIAVETTTTVTLVPESTVTSDKQTVQTKVQMTTAVNVTVYTTTVTTQVEKEPQGTDAPVTESHVVTELPTENKEPETVATTESLSVNVPVWKGITANPESASVPNIDCRFGLCPNDANDRLRIQYGIPPESEYDLTQHQCLLIDIKSGYSMTAVIGGKLTPEGLILKVAYLNQASDLAVLRYAIPLPEDFTVKPESCYAEFIESVDETEFQAMLTDSPMIEIIA